MKNRAKQLGIQKTKINRSWTEEDKELVKTKSNLEDQLLMSSFLNAMQTLSRSLFGQNVNELAFGNYKIIFKQKNEFLCGIKVREIDYRFFSKRKMLRDNIFNCLESILEFFEKEKENGEIMKLSAQQKDFIENKIDSCFKSMSQMIHDLTK